MENAVKAIEGTIFVELEILVLFSYLGTAIGMAFADIKEKA